MRKKPLLIIFLFSLISTFLIYKILYKYKYNITLLGDNYLINLYSDNYTNYLENTNSNFLFNNKNYLNIYKDIKNNYYIYNKGEKEYINQVISNSDLIIINSNNANYQFKCSKSNNVLKEYNKKTFDELEKLIDLITKISDSDIIIIGNYCINYNKEISDYLNDLYKKYNYINMYELYNKNKDNIQYEIFKKIKSYK